MAEARKSSKKQVVTEKLGGGADCGDFEVRRSRKGRFVRGASGNPEGRPPRNRASLLMEGLMDGRATALAEKAIEMALAGDVLALRLCIDRILPARKERHMVIQLPAPATAEGITAGFGKVVEALTNGELTPTETNSASMLLENARRTLETTDLARRIDEIEERIEGKN
jgi:hypothetical protein